MVSLGLISIAEITLIYYFLGLKSLYVFFLTAIGGMFFVEWVNYIEHYGLKREKDKNGIYESITL
jgi:alkane 1-monooxygenase